MVLLLLGLSVFVVAAQAASPQETLNQYVSNLQKNPNDYVLREKIIRYVQTMKPAPAMPRDAERFMNRGAAAAKSAKDANDFKDAVAEFEKATLAAPWMANAYYNLGVAQDKAGMHSNAIRSLKFYLVAAPNAPDAKNVEKLIDEIEYRQEKAAKESSPQGIAEKKQNTFDDLVRKIDGRRYATRDRGRQVLLDVRGRTFVLGCIEDNGSYTELYRTEIRGREFTEPVQSNGPAGIARIVERTWIISETGERITLRWKWSSGEAEQLIYLWQR
jgi:tetratricopeptide (TPR) repeat protein